jgi:hypothetical protein
MKAAMLLLLGSISFGEMPSTTNSASPASQPSSALLVATSEVTTSMPGFSAEAGGQCHDTGDI